jgi:hypothetical protein
LFLFAIKFSSHFLPPKISINYAKIVLKLLLLNRHKGNNSYSLLFNALLYPYRVDGTKQTYKHNGVAYVEATEAAASVKNICKKKI